MKIFKIIVLLISLGLASLFFINLYKNKDTQKEKNVTTTKEEKVKEENKLSNNPVLTSKQYNPSLSLFIPYWTISDSIDQDNINKILDLSNYLNYNPTINLIYFGISPLYSGQINTYEQGLLNIKEFTDLIENIDKSENNNFQNVLTVRMLDPNINEAILENKEKQKITINESIDVAKENNFSGILLDLEMSSTLPTEKIIENITSFIESFSKEVKKNNLSFLVTLYGDTFYRERPYDVKEINKYADQILVMTYDLHKSKGPAGPNFPLEGKEKYGYDLKTASQDFLKLIPAEKLTFVFGMYGYEWTVDEKKRPIAQAKALSLNEIRKKYLDKCVWQDCVIKKDELSTETEINFIDSEIENNFASLYYHIVWFENEESVKEKVNHLKSIGINNFGYWAYGYY